MLTKKHFEHLAVLAADAERGGNIELRDEVADFCAQHGANFDRGRFMHRVVEHLDNPNKRWRYVNR